MTKSYEDTSWPVSPWRPINLHECRISWWGRLMCMYSGTYVVKRSICGPAAWSEVLRRHQWREDGDDSVDRLKMHRGWAVHIPAVPPARGRPRREYRSKFSSGADSLPADLPGGSCGERVWAEKICEDKREKIHGEIMKKMREHSPCNLVSLVTALLLFRPNE